jgi:uncharacterized phage protein (predicted DNA packaging)
MILSEIILSDVTDYLRVDFEDDNFLIEIIMKAAQSYIVSYTGLTLEVIDTKEDLTVAFMVLCSDMYDKRQYTVNNDKVNPVVKTILDMHCINLL